uniref:Uncharacterized protein n=1 Tax=Eptatretus burgeri TaxID=7764 RepID=A0A8C4N2S4_EPTBU
FDRLSQADQPAVELVVRGVTIPIADPPINCGPPSFVETQFAVNRLKWVKLLGSVASILNFARPTWYAEMTAEELAQDERDSFLEWRRQLARLQEKENLTLTPFEKNLEFWRQLWRVIERSDIVVQIVDARNPLLFRCEDLHQQKETLHVLS